MIAFRGWCEAGARGEKVGAFPEPETEQQKKKKVSVVVWGKFGSAGVIIYVSEDDHVRDR